MGTTPVPNASLRSSSFTETNRISKLIHIQHQFNTSIGRQHGYNKALGASFLRVSYIEQEGSGGDRGGAVFALTIPHFVESITWNEKAKASS